MRSSRIAYCLARVMDAFVTAKPPFWDGQGFLQRLPRQQGHKLPMASGPPGTVMRAPKGGLLPAGPADTAPHRKIHVFFKLNSCLRRQYPYRFCRAIPMDLSIWCAFMNLLVPCGPCRVLPSAACGGMDRQRSPCPCTRRPENTTFLQRTPLTQNPPENASSRRVQGNGLSRQNASGHRRHTGQKRPVIGS